MVIKEPAEGERPILFHHLSQPQPGRRDHRGSDFDKIVNFREICEFLRNFWKDRFFFHHMNTFHSIVHQYKTKYKYKYKYKCTQIETQKLRNLLVRYQKSELSPTLNNKYPPAPSSLFAPCCFMGRVERGKYQETLPEAQRTQGIDSISWVNLSARIVQVALLELVANFVTRWRHLN